MTTVGEIPLQCHATSEQRIATFLLRHIEHCLGDLISFVFQVKMSSVDQEGLTLVNFTTFKSFETLHFILLFK